ncbi:hypothetical protein DSECCO2_584320 [anaerobic digester metagenome]
MPGTDDGEHPLVPAPEHQDLVSQIGVPLVDQGLGAPGRELPELLHGSAHDVLVSELVDVDLLPLDTHERIDQGSDEFDLLPDAHPAPEPGKCDPDIPVDERHGLLVRFGLLDGGEHLGTGLHAGFCADPLLDVGEHPLNEELAEVPAFQDLPYRGFGRLLSERYEPAPVELDADDIGLELLDGGSDFFNALPRDVRRSDKADLSHRAPSRLRCRLRRASPAAPSLHGRRRGYRPPLPPRRPAACRDRPPHRAHREE